jgi:hypothetical protein
MKLKDHKDLFKQEDRLKINSTLKEIFQDMETFSKVESAKKK